ncbi:MAG: hypothetical protein Q9164_000209 [Protoblastenia rupestris]
MKLKSFTELDRELGSSSFFPQNVSHKSGHSEEQRWVKHPRLQNTEVAQSSGPTKQGSLTNIILFKPIAHDDINHTAMTEQQGLSPTQTLPAMLSAGYRAEDGSGNDTADPMVARKDGNAASGPFNPNDGESRCRRDKELEIVGETRDRNTPLVHKVAEKHRRNLFNFMLLDLREEALDVITELDANKLEQYEKYLPIEIIKEKDAQNNKRGITKISSLIAGIIKIKELKDKNEVLKAALMSGGGCQCINQLRKEGRSRICSSIAHWTVIDNESSRSSENSFDTLCPSSGSSNRTFPRSKPQGSPMDLKEEPTTILPLDGEGFTCRHVRRAY